MSPPRPAFSSTPGLSRGSIFDIGQQRNVPRSVAPPGTFINTPSAALSGLLNLGTGRVQDALNAGFSLGPRPESAPAIARDQPGFGGGFGGGGQSLQAINTARTSTGLAPLTFQQAAATPGAPAAPAALTPEEQRQQRILADIDALRGRVSGASSSLLTAGLGSLQAQRDVSVGTVRNALAQRGVLGSSFGQASINQANAEFAQQEAQFRSSVEAQELEATRQILAFETDVLNENLRIELAEQQISNQFELGLQQIANLNAQLKLQEELERSRGLGALFGGIGGFVAERLFPPTINIGRLGDVGPFSNVGTPFNPGVG